MSLDYPTEDLHVAVVIVLFHPSDEDVANAAYLAEAYDGVIVDNSEEENFQSRQVGRMHYLPLMQNEGIAEAHNKSISIIMQEGKARYIVLLDQDSRCPTDYPRQIAKEYCQLRRETNNLCALGPTVCQIETGEEYKSAFHKDNYVSSRLIKRKDIIASGCCLSVEAIQQVGLFDAALFIDFVDTEWCYRASSKGFVCGITPNVQLYHKVGKKEIHIGRHIVSISAPFRYYYQYRNYVILTAKKHVPVSFKINFGIKFLLRFFYIPLIIKDGWSSWKYMAKGIRDGISSILKPLHL